MTDARVLQCSISDDGKHVNPCSMLEDCVTDYGNRKVKGVVVWRFETLNDAKPSRTFYGVKSGAHTARGAAFNFCPFCGEKISAPFDGGE